MHAGAVDSDKLGIGIVGSINPGVGMPTLPTIIDNLLVVGGSTGDLADVKVKPQGGTPRRISWHEIVGE